MEHQESERRIKGKFTEEQFLDFELASALMESGYIRTRTLALILGTDERNIRAIKQGFASYYGWHLAHCSRQKGSATRQEYANYLATQIGFTNKYELTVAQRAGFNEPAAYRAHIANKNGFESWEKYQEWRDELKGLSKTERNERRILRRGFDSYSEYNALVRNPQLLIIAALKDSDRPLPIDEIRSYIAETFGITFRKKGKLERTIEAANKFAPALFTAQSGIYSLNLDSPRLQDILEGDELTP